MASATAGTWGRMLPKSKAEIGQMLGLEALKALGRRIRVEVQANRRPWKNGDPPKVAEIGWGRVGKTVKKGYGASLKTKEWYLKVYVVTNGNGKKH